MSTLTSAQRKATPLFSGCLKYFPLALAAVARVSRAGNEKHNPGKPLHWSREKSNDHLDCAARHLSTFHEIDPENGELHGAEGAWRMLAELQLAEEARTRNTTVGLDAKPPGAYLSPGQTSTGVKSATAGELHVALKRGADELEDLIARGALNGLGKPANELATQIGVSWCEPVANKPIPRTQPDIKADVTHEFAAPPPAPLTFWYLATPYTKFPAGHEAAFHLASKLAAHLMTKGVPVFSPIAHSHPIANWMEKKAVTDHDLWMKMDGPLMEAASGLIVVTAESWEKSSGMREEIKRFSAAGKPIVYWAPDCSVPLALLK